MKTELILLVKQAAQRTWQTIAGDSQAIPGWEGTHEDICEMVFDAGRISMIGGLKGEALEEWDKLDCAQQEKSAEGWF